MSLLEQLYAVLADHKFGRMTDYEAACRMIVIMDAERNVDDLLPDDLEARGRYEKVLGKPA